MKRILRTFTDPKVQRPLFALLLLMVGYLSLKPGSSVQEEFWLPSAWGLLLDIYDAWKNAFGFGVLAGTAFLGWPGGWGGKHWQPPWPKMMIGLSGVLLIATFEGIQFFMPRRHSDPADIIAGGFGIAFAAGVSHLLQRWLQSNAHTQIGECCRSAAKVKSKPPSESPAS